MAPQIFEFGSNGVANMQSRISLLELEIAEKKKQIVELETENEKIKGLYEKARDAFLVAEKDIIKGADEHRIKQLRKLQDDNNTRHKMSEEELDKLNSKIRDKDEEIAQKERQYKILEDEAAEFLKEVKAEKEKVADRDARVKKLLEQATAREEYIEGVEEKAHGFQNNVEQLERTKQHVETQVTQAKEERDVATEGKKAVEKSLHDKQREAEGFSSELRAANIDKSRLAEENARLLSTIADLQHVQVELAEEQVLTAGLRDQVGRLGDELPRFDLSPTPHLAPSAHDGQPKTARTLANELDELGTSHDSGAESDASTAKASSHGSGSSSTSSDDEGDEDSKGEVEVTEIIKNVPSPTVYIYVPYQTFAHNPFTCWFLTERNLVLLFGCWLSWVAAPAASWLRRASRTQNSERSTPFLSHQYPNGAKGASLPTPSLASSSFPLNANSKGTASQRTSKASTNGNIPQSSTMADVANILGPAPANDGPAFQPGNAVNNNSPTSTGAQNGSATPAQNSANLTSYQSSCGGNPPSPQALARELIEPLSPAEDNRPIIPSGENLPLPAGTGSGAHFHQRRWLTTDVDPNSPPNAFQTISAMIIHLIFYYFLWVCYSSYKERDLWRGANEATRVLLVDILALRSRSGRGLASHIFSEEVVRIIDRFILAAISLFNIEIKAYPTPG